MKLKILAAAAGLLVSGHALAGVSGNVGVVSEYMFRGITQTYDGVAVQGGFDFASDSGFYAGTWASNVDWGVGGSEIDLYGGYGGALGENLKFDLGAIYYYYPEADEQADAAYGDGFDPNTIEVYAGLIFGPITVKYFYSPNYFGNDQFSPDGDDVSSSYIVGSGAFPISEAVSFTASIGFLSLSEETLCDGVDLLCVLPDGTVAEATDAVVDYSIGLAAAIDETLSATFAVVGTDLEADDPGVVIGAKKVFGL